MNPNETQVGGSHYKAGLQHWDYAIRRLGNRYLEGNITKYVVRYKKKHGSQDLKKAIHYLEKLINEFENMRVTPLFDVVRERFPVVQFYDDNDLDERQRNVLHLLGNWSSASELGMARQSLTQMLQRVLREEAELEARKAGAECPVCGERSPCSCAGKGYVDQD